jgi:hypothetical protein
MGARKQRPTVAEHHCVPAGVPLLRIRDVALERRIAATNADVWPPDGGKNALFEDEAPLCPQCWMAYLAPIGKWCRSLASPDGFWTPLAPAIRRFPVPDLALPASTVIYNQLYGNGAYTESAGYWYERDDPFTRTLRKYAGEHGLTLDIEPGPTGRENELLVYASFSRHL